MLKYVVILVVNINVKMGKNKCIGKNIRSFRINIKFDILIFSNLYIYREGRNEAIF